MAETTEIKLLDGGTLEFDPSEWTTLGSANRTDGMNGITWNVIVAKGPDGSVLVYLTESVRGDVSILGGMLRPSVHGVIDAVYRMASVRPAFQESIDDLAANLVEQGCD